MTDTTSTLDQQLCGPATTDTVVRETAEAITLKYLRDLTAFDSYEISDVLYDRAEQAERYDISKALEASNNTPEVQAVREHLEQTVVRLTAALKQTDVPALLAEVDRLRAALTAEMGRRDDQARQALLDYRDANHRPNGKATGYCICGDEWDHDEPCDEYQGLTEAAEAVTR